jgi:hypothetical protein
MERASIYGCRAKIHRAKQDLLYLDSLIALSTVNHEHGIFTQVDEQVGLGVVRVVFPYATRLWWGTVIGEIAHDLRSALDNLVSQLVILNGESPTKRNQFPIFAVPAEYAQKVGSYLRGTTPIARTLIEALQPYHAGNGSRSHPLWLLAELSNQDKHRVPPLAVLNITAADIRMSHPAGKKIFAIGQDSWPPVLLPEDTRLDAFEDHADIMSFVLVMPGSQVNVDFQFTTAIAFADVGDATGQPVRKTLHALADFVEMTLERDFAPLFPDPPRGWILSPPWD